MTQSIAGTPVASSMSPTVTVRLAYYRDILGCELRGSDDFGDFLQSGCALLRITALPDGHDQPASGTRLERGRHRRATVAALRRRGVDFAVYEGMGQDDRVSGPRPTVR